jgi:hypothetical protein
MKQLLAWALLFETREMECKNRFSKRWESAQNFTADDINCFIFYSAFWHFMSCRTSVAHMDSTKVVDIGLAQMLSIVVDKNFDDDLDVLIYSFSTSQFCCFTHNFSSLVHLFFLE